MGKARHPMPPAIAALSREAIAERHLLPARGRSRLPNDALEPASIQIVFGCGRPERVGYTEEALCRRAAHLGG